MLYKARFNIHTNADWVRKFKWMNGTQPVDLANSTLRLQVRKTVNDPVVLELTTANGGILIDSTIPGFKIVMKKAQLINLQPGSYVFDLIRTMDDNTEKALYGDIVFFAGVTR